jgi:ribonuclease HI
MHILNTDGGARGNPGPGAAGIVLRDVGGNILREQGYFLGHCTNNEAEYQALILGLEEAVKSKVKQLACYLDSQLIVKQLNGEYMVKDMVMKELYSKVKVLEKSFEKIKYYHVSREKNKLADKIVNDVLNEQKASV